MRRPIIILTCILTALLPALLIVIGLSDRGELPASLDGYRERLQITDPAGDSYSYTAPDRTLALLCDALESAAEVEEAQLTGGEYHPFSLILEGERRLTGELLLSYRPPAAALRLAEDSYYRIPEKYTLSLLGCDFAACLWMGEAPPAAFVGQIKLEEAAVAWSYRLDGAHTFSTEEYVSRTPTDYTVSSFGQIDITFERTPTSTAAVVYDGEGRHYYEGPLSSFDPDSLPTDRELFVMYSATWEYTDGHTTRAGYLFRLRVKS